MVGAAPIARFSLAYAAGVAAGLVGVPAWVAPWVVPASLLAPRSSSRRPDPPSTLAVVMVVGWLAGASGPTGCTAPAPGTVATLAGRFLVTPRDGSAPFEREDGCGTVTVVVGDSTAASMKAGVAMSLPGRWRSGRYRPWFQADGRRASGVSGASGASGASGVSGESGASASGGSPSGVPVSEDAEGSARAGIGDGLRWASVRWRDDLVGRLRRLYGERGPIVAALVLARREGLDPDVREAFAVAGIAHLLAISGFHVGVIAGLALTLLSALGTGQRRAVTGSAVAVWIYVALIGLPDAAVRAALILTLVALSRARGVPPTRWGGLGAAALILLLVDPHKLASPGFQLSFAGAAGLVAWEPGVRAAITARWRNLPTTLSSGVASGLAATAATLPIVAWHFERVSAVGIPVTLLATPLVALALPGAIGSLAADLLASLLGAVAQSVPFAMVSVALTMVGWLAGSIATFLAGGVSALLSLLVLVSTTAASAPWASVWTSRMGVVAGCLGVLCAVLAARRPGVGARGRRAMTFAYALAAVIGWPALAAMEGRGSLEIVTIDVGQGDAIALRTPRGRWILVDAGPPARGDPAAHPAVRALRGRGVRRLEALILSHADADHFGGALPILDAFDVGVVLDPVLPVPKPEYAALVATARSRGIPWSPARSGRSFELDGVLFRVLHPTDSLADAAVEEGGARGVTEANDLSVVLLVEWRGFRALLTGDAYVDVERAVAPDAGDVDVLKVGHHGSTTSTDSSFLRLIRPELALVSAGRGNRYGHPAPEVVARLERAGAHILRTDREGTLRVIVGRDGGVRVRTGRTTP